MREVQCALGDRGFSSNYFTQARGDMGRKKYFCDFCLRYFNDDRNIRSKHLNSVAHLKAKSDHYDLFKDPEIVLKENLMKKPCRRFQTDGYCQFGNSCIYSHYTGYELNLMRQEIERRKISEDNIHIPPVEVFYQKYYDIKNKKPSTERKSIWSHELPVNLLPMADGLPLSMLPYKVKIYEDLSLDDWG